MEYPGIAFTVWVEICFILFEGHLSLPCLSICFLHCLNDPAKKFALYIGYLFLFLYQYWFASLSAKQWDHHLSLRFLLLQLFLKFKKTVLMFWQLRYFPNTDNASVGIDIDYNYHTRHCKIYEIGSRKPFKTSDPEFKFNESKPFDFLFCCVQCLVNCSFITCILCIVKAVVWVTIDHSLHKVTGIIKWECFDINWWVPDFRISNCSIGLTLEAGVTFLVSFSKNVLWLILSYSADLKRCKH